MKKILKLFLKLEKRDQVIFLLICSMISNFFVAIIKFIFSITIPSLWFFMNAEFSFILAICRFLTIRKYHQIKRIKDKEIRFKEELKNYFYNGIMLILLGIVYFCVSLYMYNKGTNTNMHEYITYLVALITFYMIGTAIYGMKKYKKNQEPIMKAIKITNFANALTSIVLTQVVLLDTFSSGYDSRINGYTGILASLIIVILGFYMIMNVKKDSKVENIF